MGFNIILGIPTKSSSYKSSKIFFKKGGTAKKREYTWDEIALKELRKYEDDFDIEITDSDIGFEGVRATSGHTDWLIFKNVDKAEQYAIDQVKEDLENEPGIFTQSWLENFIYISDTDKRIMANEQVDSYVGDIDNERIIEEAGYDIKEYSEVNEKEQNEMLEKAKKELEEKIYNQWYDGLDNPIDFLVNEQGIYNVDDLLKQSFIQIDYDKASENAVQVDGISHFLSMYDAKEINLSSGAVAYKN